MKSGCIQHPEREPLAILRQSYIELCGGNRCAALLLSDFEYWHDIKLAQREQEIIHARADPDHKPDLSLWVYKSTPDLVSDLLGQYARDKILNSIQILLAKGFLEVKDDPRSSMSRVRFFLFVPDAVNAELMAMPIAPLKSGADRGRRKADYRESKKRLSEKPANDEEMTVGKATVRSRLNDPLPYTETTRPEVTSSSSSGSSCQPKGDEEEDLTSLANAIAVYVVATPHAVAAILKAARDSDDGLSATDAALAVPISVPPGYAVRHWRYFVTALPQTLISTRFKQELREARRRAARHAELEAEDEAQRRQYFADYKARIDAIATKMPDQLTDDDRWFFAEVLTPQEREELEQRRSPGV